MRVLPVLAAFTLLFAGCLQDGGEAGADGMREVRIETATFDAGSVGQPFLVDLVRPVDLRVEVREGGTGPVAFPAIALVMTEEDWLARGECRSFTPVTAVIRDGTDGTRVEAGRYVVWSNIAWGGSALVSFGDGPLVQVAPARGGGGASFKMSSSPLGLQDHRTEKVEDPGEPRLLMAYVAATANAPEVQVTHALELSTEQGTCASSIDWRHGEDRLASVWAWVSGDYALRAEAWAVPVPPRADFGTVEMSWTFH